MIQKTDLSDFNDLFEVFNTLSEMLAIPNIVIMPEDIPAESLRTFQRLLIKDINKSSYVKICSGISVTLNEKNHIQIIIHFKDERTKTIHHNFHSFLSKKAKVCLHKSGLGDKPFAFTTPHQTEITYQVPTKPQLTAIEQVINNMLPLLTEPQETWEMKFQCLTEENQTLFLRETFNEIVFKDLKILFPFLSHEKQIQQNDTLMRCFMHNQERLIYIQKRAEKTLEGFLTKVHTHIILTRTLVFINNSFTVPWDQILSNIEPNKRSVHHQNLFLSALVEDLLDEYQSLFRKFKILETQFNAFYKARFTVIKIFQGVSAEEQCNILADNKEIPPVESVISAKTNMNKLGRLLQNRIAYFTEGFNLIEEHVNTLAQEPRVAKPRVRKKVQEQSLTCRDTSSTVPDNYALSFFEQKPALSDTAESKKWASERLNKEKQRQELHHHRAEHPAEEASDTASIEENLSFFMFTNSNIEKIDCFPIGKTAHLFFTCASEIPPSVALEDFKQVALQGRVLAQNSLGRNGIKIYGLDLMIIKTKKHSGQHLLFISIPIMGTENFVFIPQEIITHEHYERLLNQPKLLAQYAEKVRSEIKVSCDPDDFKEDNRYTPTNSG